MSHCAAEALCGCFTSNGLCTNALLWSLMRLPGRCISVSLQLCSLAVPADRCNGRHTPSDCLHPSARVAVDICHAETVSSYTETRYTSSSAGSHTFLRKLSGLVDNNLRMHLIHLLIERLHVAKIEARCASDHVVVGHHYLIRRYQE
jgi:hypothetical protein